MVQTNNGDIGIVKPSSQYNGATPLRSIITMKNQQQNDNLSKFIDKQGTQQDQCVISPGEEAAPVTHSPQIGEISWLGN